MVWVVTDIEFGRRLQERSRISVSYYPTELDLPCRISYEDEDVDVLGDLMGLQWSLQYACDLPRAHHLGRLHLLSDPQLLSFLTLRVTRVGFRRGSQSTSQLEPPTR